MIDSYVDRCLRDVLDGQLYLEFPLVAYRPSGAPLNYLDNDRGGISRSDPIGQPGVTVPPTLPKVSVGFGFGVARDDGEGVG